MGDFIEPFGIRQNRLAVSIGVPPRRIKFWINLQSHHDLEVEQDALGAVLDASRLLLQSA